MAIDVGSRYYQVKIRVCRYMYKKWCASTLKGIEHEAIREWAREVSNMEFKRHTTPAAAREELREFKTGSFYKNRPRSTRYLVRTEIVERMDLYL